MAGRVLVDDEAFTSGIESMEIVSELERRRALVAEGKDRLLRDVSVGLF